jgi:hypothetical protein
MVVNFNQSFHLIARVLRWVGLSFALFVSLCLRTMNSFIQTRVSERLHRPNAFHLSVNPLIFYSLIDPSELELISSSDQAICSWTRIFGCAQCKQCSFYNRRMLTWNYRLMPIGLLMSIPGCFFTFWLSISPFNDFISNGTSFQDCLIITYVWRRP